MSRRHAHHAPVITFSNDGRSGMHRRAEQFETSQGTPDCASRGMAQAIPNVVYRRCHDSKGTVIVFKHMALCLLSLA